MSRQEPAARLPSHPRDDHPPGPAVTRPGPRLSRRRLAGRALGAGVGVVSAACAPSAGGGPPGGPSEPEPATVRLRLYTGSPARAQALEQATVEWKKEQPRLTLELEITEGAGPHTQALMAQLAGGTPPDAAVSDDVDGTIDLALDGVLLPLDDQMKAARVSRDEFAAGAIEYANLRGKQYGLPSNGYTTLLFYNRDLFQRSNHPLPPADGSWKWNDLQEAALKLTRRDPTDPQHSQWGLLPSFQLRYDIPSVIWQNGGTMTDTREAPARTTIHQPQAAEALQWLVDLRQRHQVMPSPQERQALGGDPFVLGKVAMFWGAAFLFFTTMSQVRDFAWDVAPGPRGPSGTQAAGTGVTNYVVFKATRQPAAAFKAIHFFTAGTGQRLVVEISNFVPAHKRMLQDVWARSSPAVNRQAAIDSYAYTKHPYKGALFSKWNTAVTNALNPAWNGEVAVRPAAEEASRQGDEVLKEAAAKW
ncbi:MAG TPA: sugar ABC transporter substrate-binding protein [Chloroflexota bacterium]|nr:sugar ABC transporter substrate-binding protein [Chloroflexota bacterium]